MARKRRPIELEQPKLTELAEVHADENPIAETRSSAISLADIRNQVMRQHTEVAQTIADLEAWRAEIDCTLAFLRARR